MPEPLRFKSGGYRVPVRQGHELAFVASRMAKELANALQGPIHAALKDAGPMPGIYVDDLEAAFEAAEYSGIPNAGKVIEFLREQLR